MASIFQLNLDGWNDMTRQFADLNADFPEWKRILLRQFGEKLLSAVSSTYHLDLPLNNVDGHRFPTAYRNQIGQSMFLLVDPSPRANWAVVRVGAEHISVVESGRAPGPIDDVEKEGIRNWAAEKLGVTDVRAVTAIIRKIENNGIYPRRLIADATGPGTPRGNRLRDEIDDTVRPTLARLMNTHGLQGG